MLWIAVVSVTFVPNYPNNFFSFETSLACRVLGESSEQELVSIRIAFFLGRAAVPIGRKLPQKPWCRRFCPHFRICSWLHPLVFVSGKGRLKPSKRILAAHRDAGFGKWVRVWTRSCNSSLGQPPPSHPSCPTEHEGVARTEQLLLIWDGTDTGTRESCTAVSAPCSGSNGAEIPFPLEAMAGVPLLNFVYWDRSWRLLLLYLHADMATGHPTCSGKGAEYSCQQWALLWVYCSCTANCGFTPLWWPPTTGLE